MLVIFPALMASFALLFFIVIIAVAIVVISKIGLSILCIRNKKKQWGLLWFPLVYGWFEGNMISFFLCKGKESTNSLLIKISWTILHILCIALPVAVFLWGPHYRDDNYDKVNDVVNCIGAIAGAIQMIILAIAMKRAGKNLLLTLCVSYFIAPFWTFFMIKESKYNYFEMQDETKCI